MTAADLAELADLIARARYDLAQGWPEAALDALGRAARLVQQFQVA